MSELSKLSQHLPDSEQINKMLMDDFTKDEASEVMEVQKSDERSETGDRIPTDIDPELAEVSLYILNKFRDVVDLPLDWPHWRNMIAEAIKHYVQASSIDDDVELLEESHRATIKTIRKGHAHQMNEIGDLISNLYLDLHHVARVSRVLMQFADSQSPEAIRTVASLIDYQCMGSLARIRDHQETAHYPSSLIQKDERSKANLD